MRRAEKFYLYFMVGAISGKLWGLGPGLLLCVIVLLVSELLFGFFEEREI